MTQPSDPSRPSLQPSTAGLLRWFESDHLPAEIRAASIPFGHLAAGLVDLLPESDELLAALRKLLEAKDCAVRAAIDAARAGASHV